MNEMRYRIARRSFLGLIAAAVAGQMVGRTFAAAPAITVHKDPNCGCCSRWIDHLRSTGFSVDVHETADLAPIRQQRGIPRELAACHTAAVSGYVLEGHVPVLAIQRLLAESPNARGLAVPGMPIGSPGMEGGEPQPYTVVLFGPAGQTPYMRFIGNRQLDK
ncbi:metal-binding protein [Bradyrhizobium sp. CCBAU 051011]|uniref:DUF411 domain-containing protein n=1 Tax=Bradyrhizobium sp. CCBAU 051011 TaxID=858422 RepID=UPI0013746309|nr:DUF411 domain-containing protein [Bradyrhizobium sp. CCBAU 051011]QHO74326.1 metal-binding protein [Bradyrhizobium sp. CCBAU 051011]